jgi:hypothetical protein
MTTRTVTLQFLGDSKQLQDSMDAAGLSAQRNADTIGDKFDDATSKASGGFRKLGQSIEGFTGIPVTGFFDKIASKFEQCDTKGAKFGQTMKMLGGATALGAAAGLVAVGAESIHLADTFDTAQSALEVSIKNSGGSFDALKPKIDATYESMANLGFNQTEVAGSLQQLTTSTGSGTRAIQLESTAADLARLKHVSLSDATGVLVKSLAGSTKALTAMGLNLDIGSGKLSAAHNATQTLANDQDALSQVEQKVSDGSLKGVAAQQALANAHRSVSEATEALNRDQSATSTILDTIKKKTEGAASAYGKTLTGQMAVAKAQVEDLGTKFGTFLTPKIETIISIGAKLTNWLLANKPVLIALAAVIGGVLVAATVAWTVSLFAAGGALAFVTLPILLVIAVVTALAAAVYEIITHWSQITAFFAGIWGDVKSYFMDAVHFVETLFLDFTPEGLIISHWSQITSFFSNLWGDVRSGVSGFIGDLVSDFTGLPGQIAAVLEKGFDAFDNVGISIVDSVIDGLNDVINTIDSGIAAISIFGFHPPAHVIPNIPHLSTGGIVQATPGGTLALLGEGGRDEAVIPLGGTSSPSMGAGPSVNVYVQTQADPNQIGAQVAWAVRR